MIPKDPVMLLSYVNTQLRDFYPPLSSMCEAKGLNREQIKQKREGTNSDKDRAKNKFVKENRREAPKPETGKLRQRFRGCFFLFLEKNER